MRVPEYLYCLLGALTFSIACNAVWMWVSMYLGKRDCASQQSANLRDIRRLAKCGYFFYQAACLLYAAGISQMVKVFNPEAVASSHLWGTFWHGLFLGEEYGMYIIIPSLVALELYFCYATKGLDSPRIQPSEHEADSILQLANRFAGRALFNVGFCQHALARYQYHKQGIYQQRANIGEGRTSAIWMNAFFWHFVIGSTYCLLTVVYIATLFVVYIESVPTQCRQKYLSRLWAAWKYCRMSFHLGLVLALLGASLTAWGCSDVCDQPNVPGGACYANVWYVPLTTCSVAAGTVLIFRFYVRACGRKACREDDKADQAGSALSTSRTEAATATMKMVGTIGDVGTIAAGFVMYNIATFNTDVIQGPLFEPDINFGLTVWGRLFLWANWCAFALGSAAALCVVEVELVYYDLTRRGQQVRFILGIRATAYSLCGFLISWAMQNFLLAFGLFGLAKMQPMRVESLVVALLGGGLIMTEVVHLLLTYKHALRAVDGAGPTNADDHGDDAFDGLRALRPHEMRLEQLSAGAARALLFGGFAYNAVSFIFRPAALLAPTYTIAMGLSFTSSIYVTVCEVAVNAIYTTLPSRRHQELFIKKIGGTLARVQIAAVAYLMLFLAGFLIMGYIKLWTYDLEEYTEPIQVEYSYMYGWVQLVGALAAFAVILPGAAHIRGLQRRMLRQDAVVVEGAKRVDSALSVHHRKAAEDDAHSWSVYSGGLLSISNAMTFQTGNVFYEILFSAVGMNVLSDYFYFGLSALTLVLGCVGLVAASLLLFWGSAVRASCREHLVTQWLDETWHLQTLLKYVYTMSLLTWEGSMLFSSSVKYPKLWYASAGWSGFGILLVVSTGSYTRWLLSRRRRRPATCRSGSEGPDARPEPASFAEEPAAA